MTFTDRASPGGEQLGNDLTGLLGNVVGKVRHQLLDGGNINKILATEVIDDFSLGPFGVLVIIILTELEVFYRAVGLCVCFGCSQVHCN